MSAGVGVGLGALPLDGLGDLDAARGHVAAARLQIRRRAARGLSVADVENRDGLFAAPGVGDRQEVAVDVGIDGTQR